MNLDPDAARMIQEAVNQQRRSTKELAKAADSAIGVAATHHVSRNDKQDRIRALAADVAERHKELLDRLAR